MKAQIHGTAVVALMVLAGCQYLPFRSASDDSADFDLNQSMSQYKADSASPLDENASVLDRLSNGGASRISTTNKGEHSAFSVDINRGNLEAEKGNFQAAIAAYQRVLNVDPQHATAHHRMAVIADKQRNFGTADYHYRAALLRQPNNADLLNDVGYSYYLQKRYAESEQAFQRVLDTHPSHPRAASNLGRLYGKQGDYDRALAMFRRSGTEADAQAEMAKLFPQGRAAYNAMTTSRGTATGSALRGGVGGSRSPQRPSATTTNTLTANAGSFGRSISPSVTTNASHAETKAPNEITRRFKEKMNQARLQSRAKRQRRQTSTNASSAGQFKAQQYTGQQPRNVAPQSAYAGTQFQQQSSSQQPYSVHPSFNTLAPRASTEYSPSPQTNGKWNDMYADNNRQPLATNSDAFRTANIRTNGIGGPSVDPSRYRAQQTNPQYNPIPMTPTERNPLEGMTPWPPQNSVPEYPSAQGAGSFQRAGISSQDFNSRPYNSQTQMQGIQRTALHVSSSALGAPTNGTNSAHQKHHHPLNGAHASPSTGRLEQQFPSNRSRSVDDTERAALMMGMNAGPGGMFPMTRPVRPRSTQHTPPTRMGSTTQFSKSMVQTAPRSPMPSRSSASAPRSENGRAQINTMQYQQYPSNGPSSVVQPINHSQINSTAPRTYPARPLENLQPYTSGASDPLQAYRAQLAEHNSVMNTMVRNLHNERQMHAVNPGTQPMSSRQYNQRPTQPTAHYPARR